MSDHDWSWEKGEGMQAAVGKQEVPSKGVRCHAARLWAYSP